MNDANHSCYWTVTEDGEFLATFRYITDAVDYVSMLDESLIDTHKVETSILRNSAFQRNQYRITPQEQNQ